MANVNRASGFSPVSTITGASWNQQGRLYAIPTSDTSNSYAIGDAVMSLASADADGVPYIQKWGGATTTSALPLGIIVGIRTANPGVSLQGTVLDLGASYILAGTRTAVVYVYVVDDPFIIFEAQFDSTAIAVTNLHQNAAVTVTASVAHTQVTPLSTMVLTGPATTATLPIRILGAVQRPDNSIGAYVRVLCKWNYHEFGVTSGASGSVVSYLAP
ncbi:MAG: hypothetical protein KGL39_09990 [Patescibacteria group bacterium]|nr:hypothetical protein [Patescibacteria group bacterium]